MTIAPKPFIGWIACQQAFYLFPTGNPADFDKASKLRIAHALEYFTDGSATFGENAARIAQQFIDQSDAIAPRDA